MTAKPEYEYAAERAAKLEARRRQREAREENDRRVTEDAKLLRELLLAGRPFDHAAKVVEQMRDWLDAKSRGAPS
jgi:hypothetical protein